MIRGLVFDIDDTLSWERDYVRSGFEHVARIAASSDDEARRIASWLWMAFESGVRGDTFDQLLRAFPTVAERIDAAALVDAYREHRPTIALVPGAVGTLDSLLAAGKRLGVLSDGPVVSQSAKARALGLQRWFDPIVLTGSYGADFAKPGTAGFELIARTWALGPSELLYVGDNPAKDFAGPRRLGWTTIRVRHASQMRAATEPVTAVDRPGLEIGHLPELLDHLG